MNDYRLVLAGLLVCFSITATPAGAQEKPARVEARKTVEISHPGYSEAKKSRDGIGKFYMGREIAHVMGHLGKGWLERSGRELEERPSLLIRKMELKKTDVVADIGAGSGYFTFRMAKFVPEGKVLAVDIQQEMLDFMEKKKKEDGVKNVVPVLGTIKDTKLPADSVDVVLLVDAYHEFDHPFEMMRSIYKALKPGTGRVFLIEYRLEDPDVPIKLLHKMTQKQAIREMKAAGLEWIKTDDFLPRQHVMHFKRPKNTEVIVAGENKDGAAADEKGGSEDGKDAAPD